MTSKDWALPSEALAWINSLPKESKDRQRMLAEEVRGDETLNGMENALGPGRSPGWDCYYWSCREGYSSVKFVRVGLLFEYLILCRGFDEASRVCIDQRHRNRRTKEMQNHAIYLDEGNKVLLQLFIEKDMLLTFFILHDITLNNIAEFLEMRSRRNIMSVEA